MPHARESDIGLSAGRSRSRRATVRSPSCRSPGTRRASPGRPRLAGRPPEPPQSRRGRYADLDGPQSGACDWQRLRRLASRPFNQYIRDGGTYSHPNAAPLSTRTILMLVFGGPLLGDSDRSSRRQPSLAAGALFMRIGTPTTARPFAWSGMSTPARGALRSQVRARASGVGYSPLGRLPGDAAQHVLDVAGRVGADQNHGLGLPARLATPATSASRYRSQVHCFGEVNTNAMGATSRTTRAG